MESLGFGMDESHLVETVAAIAAASETTALLAEVKRLLTTPAHRIELDDLVRAELEKLTVELAHERFSPDEQPIDADSIQRRVESYRFAVADASAIAALIGRWGDEENVQSLVRFFLRLSDVHERANGVNAWVAAAWLPFLTILYAAGVAAVSAERYDVIASLYRVRRGVRSRSDEHRLAYVQCLWTFSQRNGDEMLNVRSGQRNFTPLSEYLFAELPPILAPTIGVGVEFEELFDRYEHLQAASFILDYAKKGWNWGPTGRFAWKYRRSYDGGGYKELEDEAERHGANWAPARAGLFDGSTAKFLEASIRHREDFINKLPWH
jgi:hypothetical protein